MYHRHTVPVTHTHTHTHTHRKRDVHTHTIRGQNKDTEPRGRTEEKQNARTVWGFWVSETRTDGGDVC